MKTVRRLLAPLVAVLLSGLVLGSGACGPGQIEPAPGPGTFAPRPSSSPGAIDEGRFAPARAGALHYYEEEPTGSPRHPFASIAYKAISDHLRSTGVEPPRYDARLETVGEDLARALGGDKTAYHDVVDFVLRHYGVVEAFPDVVTLTVDTEDPVAFRHGFADDAGRAARAGGRVGVGLAPRPEGGYRMALVYLPGRLGLERVPRTAPLGAILTVRGVVLDEAFRDPRIMVTHANGVVRQAERLAADSSGEDEAAFAGRVGLNDGAGRYDIEVVADGPHGPAVLGLLRVWAGRRPPDGLEKLGDDGPAATSADGVAAELLRMINHDRQKAELPPVGWHDGAAAVAVAHSQDMVDNGFVGHISPKSGTPQDRAGEAGLTAPVIRENIGKAYSARDVHQGLMASPGHRAAIMATDITHVGVGVVPTQGPDEPLAFVVTELFLGFPPALKPEQGTPKVLALVAKLRSDAGAAPLTVIPELSAIAQAACRDHITLGATPGTTAGVVEQALTPWSERFRTLATLMTVVPRLDYLTQAPQLKDAKFTVVGAGAFEGDHPSDGHGICVIVLLGRAR